MTQHRSSALRAILGLVAIAAVALPSTAHAYWFHGYWRAPIVVGVVPPPVYYAPPPVYYAPPPVYYAQPPVMLTPPPVGTVSGTQAGAPGGSCNAGSRICPMEVARPVGANCYCGGPNGRVYGAVQ